MTEQETKYKKISLVVDKTRSCMKSFLDFTPVESAKIYVCLSLHYH